MERSVMPPDEPNDEERLEELPEDNGTPFGLPDDLNSEPDDEPKSVIDSTHPATDTGVQPEEVYEEGISGAAEINESSTGHTILGYEKPDADNKPGKGEDNGNSQAA